MDANRERAGEEEGEGGREGRTEERATVKGKDGCCPKELQGLSQRASSLTAE